MTNLVLNSPFLPNEVGPKTNWLPVFLKFLALIKVSSKETTEPGPITPYEAQMRFIGELCKALEADQHHIIVLKARQLGISTIVWALDIFWLWVHPGLQGALIFDTGDNRDIARQTITEMMESLPPGYRIPVKKHNRTELVLQNGSRLQYMAAGKKKTGSGLGRSRALNFVHASECSSWGDQKGLDSLIRALAEENPNRLYIFESTALGFNLFFDMCETAKHSPSQRFCFIGWWAKEVYRIREGTEEYARWWGQHPEMTPEEAKKSAIVLARYGHQITPEQIAWYRKQAFKQSAGSLAEELPWDESEAFVATGSSYFSLTRVTEDLRQITDMQVKFEGYTYTLGKKFVETKVHRAETVADSELKVWEPPRKNGKYAIGVDGAFGRSADADRSCISVWRCFSDKCIQVAEYATPKPEAYQTAWILAHLAGSYRDCVINAELNGPGELIMRELQTVRQQMLLEPESRHVAAQLKITDALDNARWFLRHRADQVGPGKYLYNTKTTQDEKARLYGRLRDNYSTDSVIVKSVGLLDEMRTLVQDGLKIEASGRNKDDRVFSAALAVAAWTDWIRPEMLTNNQTFMREMARQQQMDAAVASGDHVMQGFVGRYFTKKQEEKQQAYLRRLIDGF